MIKLASSNGDRALTVRLTGTRGRQTSLKEFASARAVGEWLSDVGAVFDYGSFYLTDEHQEHRVALWRGPHQFPADEVVRQVMPFFRGEVRSLGTSAKVRRAFAAVVPDDSLVPAGIPGEGKSQFAEEVAIGTGLPTIQS